MEHVRQVLTLLRDPEVTLKLNECVFLLERIVYLCHVIRPGRLEIANTITEGNPATEESHKSN